MKKGLTLLLGVLSACHVTQAAETGPYVGIQGGINWVAPQYLTQQQLDFVQMNFKTPPSSGYVYGMATGWRFISGLRSELAVSYRKNTLNNFSKRYYEGGGSASGQGNEAFSGAFVNVWQKLPISLRITESATVVPYLGGGIGYGRLVIKGLSANGVHFGQAHNDEVAAWQLGAGFITQITDVYSISLDYRYMRTASAHYGLIEGLPPQDVTTHYQAQSAMLGFYHYF